MQELQFKLLKDKHILKPMNEISLKTQNISFEYLEKIQYEFINKYDEMNDDERYLNSNNISTFFIMCFLNGDGATFRRFVGNNHKGLMTNEELKNAKRDFNIAFEKRKKGEFKSFLLLDIIPSSNRRADAIIITNEYNLELYDFSEGVVAERIKTAKDYELNLSELKQKNRKNKQQKRIDSYKGKIKNNCDMIENIIVDDKQINVYYYNMDTEFYEFNYIYTLFKKNEYKATYIPNSLCFLMTKESIQYPFFALPLKYNIDSPLFITEYKPIIETEIIKDIYDKNIYIGISFIYAQFFISCFTHFKIHLSKKQDKYMSKDQFSVYKNGKKKYVYLEDCRTNNWIPIGKGIIEKHMFMNVSLKSIMIYLAKICNPEKDDNFSYNIIKYDVLKNSEFDFFVMEKE